MSNDKEKPRVENTNLPFLFLSLCSLSVAAAILPVLANEGSNLNNNEIKVWAFQ
jgi:hypothetical protein